jgi:hypothetical protein
MATVRVNRDEADGDRFPRMCVRCGEDAGVSRWRRFAWMPGWAYVLILAGLLPWLLAVLFTRRTMAVMVPVCHRHVNQWRNLNLYMWLGLLFWIAYAVVAVLAVDELPGDAGTAVIAVGIFGALGWLVTGLILVQRSVRAGEITDRWIDLVGVHRDFAARWREITRPAGRLPTRSGGRWDY